MQYISLGKIEDWKFSTIKELFGDRYHLQLTESLKRYIEQVVFVESQDMLKGIRFSVLDLDNIALELGNIPMDLSDGIGKVLLLRIQNKIRDIKRQMISDIEFNEHTEEVDMDTISTIRKFGDFDDKRYAEIFKELNRLLLLGGLSPTRQMHKEIGTIAQKVASSIEMEKTEKKMKDTWIWKYVTNKNKSNAGAVKEAEKELLKASTELIEKLHECGVDSIEELKKLNAVACKSVYCINDLGRKRVATSSEIEKLVGNMYIEYASIIPRAYQYSILVAIAVMSGEVATLFKLSTIKKAEETELGPNGEKSRDIADNKLEVTFRKGDDLVSMVTRDADGLTRNIKYIMNGLADTIAKLRGALKELKYPSVPENIMIKAADYSIKDMFERIKSEPKISKYDSIALSIVNECIKRSTYDMTEKQAQLVRKLYLSLVKRDETGMTVNVDECIALASELMENYRDMCNSTVISIAEGTIKRGYCSAKQLDVLKAKKRDIEADAKIRQMHAEIRMNASELMNGLGSEDRSGGVGSTGAVASADISSSNASRDSNTSSIPVPVFGVPDDNTSFDVDDLLKDLFGT